MKAKQKTAQTTQGKTTDYIDPKNPYITRTQNTKKLLRRKSGTATSFPTNTCRPPLIELLKRFGL